jgi:hypothetical protein
MDGTAYFAGSSSAGISGLDGLSSLDQLPIVPDVENRIRAVTDVLETFAYNWHAEPVNGLESRVRIGNRFVLQAETDFRLSCARMKRP